MKTRALTEKDLDPWISLRAQLWPKDTQEQHRQEIERILKPKSALKMECLGVFQEEELVGFIEVSLRNIVDGCSSSPVTYVEAWLVDSKHRGSGAGRALMAAAEAWGLDQGCTEIGSDTEIWREDSIQVHRQLGFQEVDRVVNFRKSLLHKES